HAVAEGGELLARRLLLGGRRGGAGAGLGAVRRGRVGLAGGRGGGLPLGAGAAGEDRAGEGGASEQGAGACGDHRGSQGRAAPPAGQGKRGPSSRPLPLPTPVSGRGFLEAWP